MSFLKRYLFPALLCSAIVSGAWQAPGTAPIKEGKVFDRHMSAARFIHADKVKGEYPMFALYRKSFTLDSKVSEAIIRGWLNSGTLWCNGSKVPSKPFPKEQYRSFFKGCIYDLKPFLKPGRNVIAFSYGRRYFSHNIGAIIRGEIKLASGKKLLLVTDKNFKSLPADPKKQPANWTAVNFDDSKWQPAKELGDAYYGYTHVTYGDSVDIYASKEEAKAMHKAMELNAEQLKRLKAEPPMQAKIVWQGTTPGIQVYPGKVLPPIMGEFRGLAPYPTRDDTAAKSIKCGIRVFRMPVVLTGLQNNATKEYDFTELGRSIQRLIQLHPDAYVILFPSLSGHKDKEWLKNHPDELIKYSYPEHDKVKKRNTWDGNWDAPSCASKLYRKKVAEQIKMLAKLFREKPWGKHILGLGYGCGPSGDGYPYGFYGGMPDCSKPMTEAFRKFAREKYRTVEALRKAYGDNSLTFENLSVPTAKERNARGHYLNDPGIPAERKLIDYYRCYNKEFGDMHLEMARVWKKEMPGRLFAAYFGYVILPYCPVGETADYERCLEGDEFDIMFMTTINYHKTSAQFRHIPSSFIKAGKLSSGEADIRTFVGVKDGTAVNRNWCHFTPAESIAAIRKVSANAAFGSAGFHLVSFNGHQEHNYWFNHPQLWTEIHRSVELWKSIWKKPLLPDTEVAYVFSPMEKVINGHPTTHENWQLYHEREYNMIDALNFSGATYDFISLKDFIASEKRYKTVIFANVHTLTDSERKLIRKRLDDHRSNAVFVMAPGFVTEKGFSDQAMQEFTRLPLTASLKKGVMHLELWNRRTLASIRWGKVEKDSPRVYAKADSSIQVWGRWADNKQPAVISKKLDNGTYSVFCGMPITDMALFRRIFKQNKTHLYTNKPAIYVRSAQNMLMVYTALLGRHRITLPRKAKIIRDRFSGKIIARDSTDFYVTNPDFTARLFDVEY